MITQSNLWGGQRSSTCRNCTHCKLDLPQASLLPAASGLPSAGVTPAGRCPHCKAWSLTLRPLLWFRTIPGPGCSEQPPVSSLWLLPGSQMSERGPFSRAQVSDLVSSGSCSRELCQKLLLQKPTTAIRVWFSSDLGAWTPRPFTIPPLLLWAGQHSLVSFLPFFSFPAQVPLLQKSSMADTRHRASQEHN